MCQQTKREGLGPKISRYRPKRQEPLNLLRWERLLVVPRNLARFLASRRPNILKVRELDFSEKHFRR